MPRIDRGYVSNSTGGDKVLWKEFVARVGVGDVGILLTSQRYACCAQRKLTWASKGKIRLPTAKGLQFRQGCSKIVQDCTGRVVSRASYCKAES